MNHPVDPMEAALGRSLGVKAEEADDSVDVEEQDGDGVTGVSHEGSWLFRCRMAVSFDVVYPSVRPVWANWSNAVGIPSDN